LQELEKAPAVAAQFVQLFFIVEADGLGIGLGKSAHGSFRLEASQPAQSFGDFFFGESGSGEFAGQNLGFWAGTEFVVVFEQVNKNVKHGRLRWQ